MPIVHMHSRKQGVGPAIEELKADICTRIPQKAVVAHPERVLGIVTAWIPPIDRSHGSGVRSNEIRKRKHAMAVLATACCESRDNGVTKPRKHACALTAVVQRVLPEGPRKRVARRRAHRSDAEVGPESFGVTLSSLFPLRRSVFRLANASRKRSADDWIGAERVEDVVAELSFLCRTHIRQIW